MKLMNKTILVLILLPFFFGCELEGDTTTVQINLGNVPQSSSISRVAVPEYINKIHIAVYDEKVAPENLLISESYDPSDLVARLIVPSGKNRIFICIADEDSGGDPPYPMVIFSGESEKTCLSSGETVSVTIPMNFISMKISLLDNKLFWEPVPGADSYDVYESMDGTDTFIDTVYESEFLIPNFKPDYDYTVRAKFSPFSLFCEDSYYFEPM